MRTAPDWLGSLCRLPLAFKAGSVPIRQLFGESAPDLSDEAEFVARVHDYMAVRPELVDAWQTYSYDKRSSPSPYLDGIEVGFFDGERRAIRLHHDAVHACADFIYREAMWVLERRQAS